MKNYILLILIFFGSAMAYSQGEPIAINDTLCTTYGDPINYNVNSNDINFSTYVYDITNDYTYYNAPEEQCLFVDQQGNVRYNPQYTGDPCCGEVILHYDSEYMLISNSNMTYNIFGDVVITIKCKPDCSLINLEDPIPNSECLSVCENSSTTVYLPHNSNNTYNWSVMGGTYVAGANPAEIEIQWGANGFGNVTATITDQTNSIQTISQCVDILLSPTANFTFNPITAINSSTVFTNTSINADAYFWNFGDGATSSLQDPSHTYTVPGSYPVTLIANRFNYDAAGNQLCCCSDTIVQDIVVSEIPCPNIYWVSTLCEGDSSKYWTDATNCGNYNWDVKDNNGNAIPFLQQGNDTICVVWNNGDFGTICLDVSGCDSIYCGFPTCVTVPIISANSSITGNTDVCEGETVVYTLPKWINVDYDWTVLDQNNQPVPFIHQGSHQITVTWGSAGVGTVHVDYSSDFLADLPNHDGNDCQGYADLSVSVRPSFAISSSTSVVCVNDVSTFSATSSPSANYNWTVIPPVAFSGQGTDQITVTWNSGVGTYVVKAMPTSGIFYCNTEETLVVEVKDIVDPDPIIGETDICAGDSYLYFVNQNTPGVGYNWTVTNGTPSSGTGSNINVTWSGAGTISVSQFMLNQPGCNSNLVSLNTIEKTINGPLSISGMGSCINSTANYSLLPVQHPDADVHWTITPSIAGSIISGQGTTNMQVQWNNDQGPATLQAEVSICGVNQLVSIVETINAPVVPIISQSTPLCENSGVTTLSTTQSFNSYQWSTNSNNATISATSPGSFNVMTTDANGCNAVGYYQLSTVPIEDDISLAGSTSICVLGGSSRVLTAVFNPTYTYQWFCNGVAQSTQSPVNSFTHNNTGVVGNFSYYVHIMDNSSGCDAISNTISISQIDCSSNSSCVKESNTVFINLSGNVNICDTYTFTPQLSNATFVSWSFGDGTFSSSPTVTHTFTQIGTYTVTLAASVPELGNPGSFCLETSTTQVNVTLVPDFSFNVNCQDAQFTDLSTSTGTITNWSWSFGSTVQNPTFTFPWVWNNPAGVSVTVTDNNSCTATAINYLDLFGAHIVSTTISPTPGPYCVDDPIGFSAIVNNANTYIWDFGDGATYAGLLPTHTYTVAGIYSVTLTVSNQHGCSDVETFSVVINPAVPPLNISPGNQIICDGSSATFIAPVGYSYLWSNGATTQSISVSTTGSYSVVITDANGCSNELDDVSLDVIPGPDATVTGNLVICDQGCTDLTAPLGQGYTYDWYGNGMFEGNGSTLNICSVLGLNNPYHVVITDNNGCSSQSAPVIISMATSPVFGVNVSPTACAGQPINLDVTPIDPNVNYTWSHGPTGPSIVETLSGVYTVIGTDQTTGCSSTATGVIHALPDLCSLPQGCYTVCDPDTICAPLGYPFYQWYKDGLPFSGIVGMDNCIRITQSGTYTVDVTNTFGCTATSNDIVLDVIPCPPDTGCENLIVSSTPLLNGNGDPDSCCVSLDYSNNSFNLIGMVIHSADADLNFDVATLDPSLNVFSLSSNSISLTSSTLNGAIPTGINDFIEMCIGEVINDPQQVIVDWYDFDLEIVCSDTITFNCPDEPPCLYLKSDSIYCEEGRTFYELTVCNPHTSNFDVGYIDMIISNPTGIILTPVSTPTMTNIVPPIYPNTCKTFIMELTGPNINGETLCYQLTSHDFNPYEVDTALCCTYVEEHCIDIPICDPCANVGIEGVNLTDNAGCCYAIDIYNNFDPNYFDEIAVCVISPGTYITNVNNVFSSPWSTFGQTTSSVSFFPSVGTVPLGISQLPEICFDTDINPSQSIEIKWIKNGEIVCRDTTFINCQPDCGYFVEEEIVCDPNGGWLFTGVIYNNTPFSIDEVVISSSNPGVSSMVMSVNIPANSYSSLIYIPIGAPAVTGDNVCFTISMHTLNVDGLYLECCNFDHCVVLPPCEGEGCICDEDFYSHVLSGIDCVQSTSNPLSWSFTLTDWAYFDPECDKVYWSFGYNTTPFYTVEPPNVTVLHTFPSSEPVYLVCATVVRTDINGNKCKEEVCKEVFFSDKPIEIHPNPTNDQFYLTVRDNSFSDFEIRISDMNGRNLSNVYISEYSNNSQLAVDVSTLAPGVYLVQVVSDERILTKRLIVE